MAVSVKVEGLRELDKRLRDLKRGTAKGVARRVLKKAGEPIAKKARRLAPDDPSTPPVDLHTSIEISSRQKSGRQRLYTRPGPTTVELHIGPTRGGYPQAMMQEFGAVHHSPTPYMRPAWDSRKNVALRIVKRELGKEIDKTVARLAKRAAKKG